MRIEAQHMGSISRKSEIGVIIKTIDKDYA